MRPGQLGFDVALALVFTLMALVSVIAQQDGLVVVATLMMGVAVAVRRLSWRLMVLLAGVVGLLQVVGGQLALFADVGYTLVFFVLGATSDSLVRRFGLAGALSSAVVLSVGVGTGHFGDAVGTGGSTMFAVVASAALALLVSGGGWAGGYVRWQSRSRVTAQVQAGLEAERTRIAADMHDLVAHTWAVVAAQADGARYALAGPGGEVRAGEALEVIADTARGSISDLRELLAQLRYREPPSPVGHAARDALVARVRGSGMELHLTEHGAPPASGVLTVAAYRLLSESLTNALKHGDLGHPVEVEEDWRAGYRLVARNRLGGSSAPGTGHGVAGMRERVQLAGGRFTAGAEGDMWIVLAVLPEPVS